MDDGVLSETPDDFVLYQKKAGAFGSFPHHALHYTADDEAVGREEAVDGFQAGLLFFGVLFGLAFAAWWATGLLGGALDRRAEGRGRVVVRSGVTAYLGVIFALGMTPAMAAVVIPPLRGLPAARMVAVGFFSLLGLLFLWRGFAARIVVDDAGVRVVDYHRSYVLAWSEIVRIGLIRYEEIGTTFGFETRGRRTITPLFLTDAGAANPRLCDALRQHATARGIPFEGIEPDGRKGDRPQ